MDSDADADKAAFLEDLRSHVGSTGTPRTSRDPVNLPTIRNWCDAMGEANPYFTDEDAAAASPHGGLIAPAATLNVWTMAGLHLGGPAPADPNEPRTAVYQKLNAAGFSSVVIKMGSAAVPPVIVMSPVRLISESDSVASGIDVDADAS